MSAAVKHARTQRKTLAFQPMILIYLGVGVLVIGLMVVSATLNAGAISGGTPDFTASTLNGIRFG